MNSLRRPRLLVGTAAGLGTLLLAVTLHGLPFGGGPNASCRASASCIAAFHSWGRRASRTA